MAIWAVKLRPVTGGRWRLITSGGGTTDVRVCAHRFETERDAKDFAAKARAVNPGWLYLPIPFTAHLGN